MRNRTVLLYFLTLYLALNTPGWSQDRRGLLTGTVTDSTHGILRGAKVELQPNGRPTSTNTNGRFTVTNLDSGSYTVTISYVGLDTYTQPVTVSAGQETHIDAELKVGSASQEITVTADHPRGEAAAINAQKTADNILEVLPAEVITSLPNINIADALGRLPDVSLERDEGEGKYVQIRGTEPRLTNVTVNGVSLASPESSVRNIKLDVIPADLVDSIEVSKTLSASQEGDAIGGSVNLITKSAIDTPTVVLSGLGGYTPIALGRHLHQENGTIGKRFGNDKKLGLLFGGTFDYNNRGIYDIEPNPAVAGGADLRDYRYDRSRYGFGVQLITICRTGPTFISRGYSPTFATTVTAGFTPQPSEQQTGMAPMPTTEVSASMSLSAAQNTLSLAKPSAAISLLGPFSSTTNSRSADLAKMVAIRRSTSMALQPCSSA